MKIAFILPKLANQGPILVVKNIVENLINKVELIDIYYFDSILKEIEFPCKTFKINFFQKIDFNNYDIIHSHMLRPDAYIWFHRRNIKARCISTIHQDIKQNLKYSYNGFVSIFFSRIWFNFLKSQDVLVMLSKEMKDNYGKVFSYKRLFIIYNGINIDTSLEIEIEDKAILEELKCNYSIIGSVALLTKRKGIDQLIKVLVDQKDLALVVVGDGKERGNLLKLATKLNVINRCLFLKYRNKGYRYIKYFDFFAMPSISEGFGLTLLEAAELEKPIICSNIPVFKELFSEKEVSFFQLFDIKSLSEAINKIKYDSSNEVKLAKEKYLKSYSAKVMAEKYLKLYKNVLKQN